MSEPAPVAAVEEALLREAVAAYAADDLERAKALFLKLLASGAGGIREAARRYLHLIESRLALLGAADREAADLEVVRRTPHLDLVPARSLRPGQSFTVAIYADTTALRPHETGQDVEITAPSSVERFDLEVWLRASRHFAFAGPQEQGLVIERRRSESTVAVFHLQVRDEISAAAGPPEISAYFTYDRRPCGFIRRAVDLAAERAAALGAADRAAASLRLEVGARPADVTIDILEGPARDGRSFLCSVRTDLVPGYGESMPEDWVLSGAAGPLVASYMESFTANDLDDKRRLDQLRGAGLELFDIAPPRFKQLLWELVDTVLPLRAGQPPLTFLITSEEPYVPWELMIPSRRHGGRIDRRAPLGVEFCVGRWSARDHTAPPQAVALQRSVVVAPRDSGLLDAEREAAAVLAAVPGQRLDPASAAALEALLERHGAGLLHFICHGAHGLRQAIHLEHAEVLDTTALRALDGVARALDAGRPLVFINACEVGRTAPSLVGPGGFAEVLMNLGAAAVIAPLWSILDSIAHDIAVEFYRRLVESPGTPFAEIIRGIRAKAYGEEAGQDTYAAYCFYGDPRAACERRG